MRRRSPTEAIESTCASSAFGVGTPIQIAVVTANRVEEIRDGELQHTELKEGSNAKARRTMSETVVVERGSEVTVTPIDGERYLRAFTDSGSWGPDFWATLIDLSDADMKLPRPLSAVLGSSEFRPFQASAAA